MHQHINTSLGAKAASRLGVTTRADVPLPDPCTESAPMSATRRAVTAWLVPFFANTVLVQAVTFVLRPTAIYRALELDVPAQWLGALGASFAVVPLLLAVPSGQAVGPLRRAPRDARGRGPHVGRRRWPS